jgi:alkanesulfonate monooxygenase SsuD/methylene tetrahydromethanopterin reductase-like flavin-dependent oxidoreductase (luciferase family)
MQPPIRFGLFMSQAGRTWQDILDGFLLAEDLGFDHGWLVDHLVDTDHGPGAPVLEAWTLLSAIAARTNRIRLGVLVTSNTFRHPALLLKEAVTVDHVSGGRLILGLGSGWNVDEHRRYGIALPEPRERVDRLAEAVELIDLLQRQDRTTFAGRYYQVEDAPLDPRPVQQPRIPLLIAAHRPRMLRLAARFADQWDTFPTIAGASTDGVSLSIAEQAEILETACREIGRDPDTIRRSTWAEADDVLASAVAFEAFVEGHRQLGFTDFTAVLPPPDGRDVLERVARETIPKLRDQDPAAH